MTLIAVTNPSDESAEAGFVHESDAVYTPREILEDFGSKLEDGAQITVVYAKRVWQYIATRDPRNKESIALRSNNALAADAGPDGEEFIHYVNQRSGGNASIIESAWVPLEADAPLEEYTVFGENDDSEPFRAVVTAVSPAAAKAAGVQAGLVDPGFEADVDIVAVIKGDVTEADVTPEANQD